MKYGDGIAVRDADNFTLPSKCREGRRFRRMIEMRVALSLVIESSFLMELCSRERPRPLQNAPQSIISNKT